MKRTQHLQLKRLALIGSFLIAFTNQARGDVSDVTSPAPAAVAPPAAIRVVPVQVVYVAENQPVQIVDSQGRLIEVLYLKKKP